MLIDYHRTMLGDRRRNEAFRRALKSVIVPGKSVVVDIGAGTGLLGFMAEKLGAKEVYLIESGPIAQVAERLIRDNHLKRCHLFAAHSTEITGLPPADVVVSETLGNYAFEENIAATLTDARRFLKKGGALIPGAATQCVCPVTAPRLHKPLALWDRAARPYGLDYAAAQEMGFNNAYIRRFSARDLLDGGRAAQVWDQADFYKSVPSSRKGKAVWTLRRDATIYGAAVWWSCDLAGGVSLDTSPLSPRTHWDQLYFPVETPLKGRKGDTVEISLATQSSYEGGTDMRWSVKVNGRGPAMDLRRGYL